MILIDRQDVSEIENHLIQLYKELKTSKNRKVLEDIIDFWEIELIIKNHKLKQLENEKSTSSISISNFNEL